MFRAARFFVLAYALTWACWLPMLCQPGDLVALHYLGSLGPAAAAIALLSVEGGRAALRDMWSRATRYRVRLRWWVLAIGLPVGLFALGSAVSAGLGTPVDWSRLLSTPEVGGVGLWLVAMEVVFFGFGEEIGWRGYAIPAFEAAGWSTYAATTIFAFFWAGWHVPLFFYDGGLGSMHILLVPGWFISILFGAYLTTYLYKAASGSILLIAVFHGMVDIVAISSSATTATLITVNAGLITAGAVAGAALARSGGRVPVRGVQG